MAKQISRRFYYDLLTAKMECDDTYYTYDVEFFNKHAPTPDVFKAQFPALYWKGSGRGECIWFLVYKNATRKDIITTLTSIMLAEVRICLLRKKKGWFMGNKEWNN